MKSVKMMMTGGLLILLGPLLANLDVTFAGVMVVLWFFGIPLFIAGLVCSDRKKAPKPLEDLPQKKCPKCGRTHDFDYPKCPYCEYDDSEVIVK